MDWGTPSKEELAMLSKLNIDNFKDGEWVIYCRYCGWQTMEYIVMAPTCPECFQKLWMVKVDKDLRGLVERANYI